MRNIFACFLAKVPAMLRLMEDLVVSADMMSADLGTLPVAVVGARSAQFLSADGEFERLSLEDAAERISSAPHLMVNRVMAARRLGLPPIRAFDALELYAFVRPARYCLPTIQGLLAALHLDHAVESDEDRCLAVQAVAARLLLEMEAQTYACRAGGAKVAMMMARAGWTWGPYVLKSIEAYADNSREDGLLVWTALSEWEDGAPPPPPGDEAVEPEESQARLKDLLGDGSEEREGQRRYAAAAAHAFRPREFEGGPNLQLLEAGTGTGKTLGYIAPASVWSQKNDGAVWLSTYTKNLQRQLDQELSKLYPDPRIKAKRAVIRKGRENYACLLNIEETLRAVMMRAGMARGGQDRDQILMGLVLRWARYTRDGDMIGGDFPSWLGAHFGAGRIAGLTDRRGECLYSACAHFRKCFVEKTARKAKHADLVVANHALVVAQAAMRGDDPDLPRRLVFDEGHHVFDAADSAFSSHLSGLEGAELRRWLRGKESGGTTRARGLKSRLDELIADDADARKLLEEVLDAATLLPSDNWLGRVTGAAAMTRFETFLMLCRAQVLARADGKEGPYGLEATTHDPVEGLVDAAHALGASLMELARPMSALATLLIRRLDEDADVLDSTSRGRLEASARSLKLRADTVTQWAAMAEGFGGPVPEEFVEWLMLDRAFGKDRDVGLCRHFVDPTKPFADIVLENAHGVVITSATLRDKAADKAADDETWQSADMRTGAQHLLVPPKRLGVPSPFDYAAQTKVLIVGDVNKFDAAQVASAYRSLFMAAGGGALGLFTAITRLRATYEAIVGPLESMDIPLYAQHVDPVDTATLVDIFRDEAHACLLGTDAVRDGVDVPGDSLRLIVFDRVPWPRPTLLHRARRAAFGGRGYDEMLTRLKLAQAYGRLVRRASDRGVFVMLDGQTPTRLLEALPDGVAVERVGLADAVKTVCEFFPETAAGG